MASGRKKLGEIETKEGWRPVAEGERHPMRLMAFWLEQGLDPGNAFMVAYNMEPDQFDTIEKQGAMLYEAARCAEHPRTLAYRLELRTDPQVLKRRDGSIGLTELVRLATTARSDEVRLRAATVLVRLAELEPKQQHEITANVTVDRLEQMSNEQLAEAALTALAWARDRIGTGGLPGEAASRDRMEEMREGSLVLREHLLPPPGRERGG